MSLVASSVMVCCPSRTKTRRLIIVHLMSIGCYVGSVVISTMEPDLVVRTTLPNSARGPVTVFAVLQSVLVAKKRT